MEKASFVIKKEDEYLIYSDSPDTWTDDIGTATRFSSEFESVINPGETYERIDSNGKA